MSVLKNELHRLLDAIPEEEFLGVKRFLEFILSKANINIKNHDFSEDVRKEDPSIRFFFGRTFYIEGALGRYAEMEYRYHIMQLDDIAGWGRLTLYDQNLAIIGDIEFKKEHLTEVWPVYYALAAKCTRKDKPFIDDRFAGSVEKAKRYVDTGTLKDISEEGLPKTLQTCLSVAKLVWSGETYNMAISTVAKSRGVGKTTIIDQCTRRIDLTAEQFRRLLKNKSEFANYLASKFPRYKELILHIVRP
ncbi:hypothetical protein [Desulfovirgula thermocuniculi]|uniref:hypothetical protein n=1 Tax=Desulfovirgula thermocuniculi TaxID=348842 RepID=UPI0004881C9B|nr:hypothetical protein [Desulfovirgula thermocuniculi]